MSNGKSLDLDVIRRRADAATPGPYRLITDSCDCGDEWGCRHGMFPFALRLPVHTVRDAERPCDLTDPHDYYRHDAEDISSLTMETAAFLAHAREDVPALLAEIDLLRGRLSAIDARARQLRAGYRAGAYSIDYINGFEAAVDLAEHDLPEVTR